MNVFKSFRDQVIGVLDGMVSVGELPSGMDFSRVAIQKPPPKTSGDLSTNAAFVLAGPSKKNPTEIAANMAKHLMALDGVQSVDVVGKGYINITLNPSVWHNELITILNQGIHYGDSGVGSGLYVNVEYVSANPTGPLHAAHARGAVVGDVLANLLKKTGHWVVREYYINDAGGQIDTLTRSAYLRHKEACGHDIGQIPEGMYPGEYLKDVGLSIYQRFGDLSNEPEEIWYPFVRDVSIQMIMDGIKQDLIDLGVNIQVFTSERDVVNGYYLNYLLEEFKKQDLVYEGVLAEPPKGKIIEDWEPLPTLLFRATKFGDDVDRPLKKSDGSWTYFANDIAYHYKKVMESTVCSMWRGGLENIRIIDVWGADHGGYVKRMQAAVSAATENKVSLDVKLCQLVHLMDNGVPVKFSKRDGNFITLKDVIDKVGKDAIRFMMLTRKNDQTLNFDFAKVVEKSKENPVFYVQYCHARCRSVLRNAAEMFPGLNFDPGHHIYQFFSYLTNPYEMAMIQTLAEWPRIVESAAEVHEPHRIAFYLHDVASAFHTLWKNGEKFLNPDDLAGTTARLGLVQAVATVVASGLNVMGVEPVEEMWDEDHVEI